MATALEKCLGCTAAIRAARKINSDWPKGEADVVSNDVVENTEADNIRNCTSLNDRTRQCEKVIYAQGEKIEVTAPCDGPNS